MQCEHIISGIRRERQCKRTAKEGFNLCDQHGWGPRYFIKFTWQEQAGDHWKDKKKAVWPILFKTMMEAQDRIDETPNIFRNMLPRRKLTCCVERTKATFPKHSLRRV